MANVIQSNFRIRKNLGSVERVIEVPNLIDIQRSSYDKVLQTDVPPNEREDVGLQAVFRSVFPIKDFNGMSELVFVSYALEKPKYDVDECRARGMTFGAPIKVTTQLMIYENTGSGNEKIVRDIKEQEVYFGEIPLMTDTGTFIINGAERVIVSQLHRSPGVFFDDDKGKSHASGKLLYKARIIPYRGSWIDFEFDPKDLIYVRIDRRRKFHATVLLRALGMTTEDLLGYFYRRDTILLDGKKAARVFQPELHQGLKLTRDVRHPETNEILVKEGRKLSRGAIRQLQAAAVEELPIDPQEVVGLVSAHDIVDEETGEVIAACNQELAAEHLEKFLAAGIDRIEVLALEHGGAYLRNTMMQDKVTVSDEAILEIYRRMRPGDTATRDVARTFFDNLFFNKERYDLSRVGRLKLNHKLKQDAPIDQGTLRATDILECVRYLIDLRNGISGSQTDDIDHLGNRRVRAVGELVENQFRIGLVRMERAIKERMSLQDIETLMPQELINYKPVAAAVKEFFGSSQLSQFMDQTNPLSEVTHKRRLSALGPGGLTRERAGFEVRDVHPTHYGRVCPIETPEGPNIGLIASLSTYARVNEHGFVETPYRLVRNGQATDDVRFLSALEEEDHVIAQANAALDEKGRLVAEQVAARDKGEAKQVAPDQVDFMDVSPNQLVSVAASLIPFLEHDDANRALMGSNMQRQAVPLLRTEAPLVGTGIERIVARDSGVTVVARRPGTVESVDAGRLVVRADKTASDGIDTGIDIYSLIKYQRSNQSTCINQKPIVRMGDRVETGDVIADGPATDSGELALGRNVLVAFMPWGGYNFEDSILVSERVVREDFFTSVHIEEFECVARDTKLGPEEITRDIPNLGEESLRDLDGSGIIRIGAEVKPGDILVGKITPKGETQLSPEEKLLRAIFGEKAGEVRDTSLKVPPGVEGTVIEARVFSRKGISKDDRARQIEEMEIDRLRQDEADQVRILRETTGRRIVKLLAGRTASVRVSDEQRRQLLAKGQEITADDIQEKIPPTYWGDIRIGDDGVDDEVERTCRAMRDQISRQHTRTEEKIARHQGGDELPPGVIKMVKIFVAIKRKLQVGDKMAGRHGNKGVLSRIVAEEDMPYLEDGTPVDIVLNPLGVPSRMNVGQILETHLGWAARRLGEEIQALWSKSSEDALRTRLQEIYGPEYLRMVGGSTADDLAILARKANAGIHVATPVFDGASEDEIFGLLKDAGLPATGQARLFDGRTGEAFQQAVTVGIIYMMKLHHLVDDKIHARSTGPYSLVTQQPLGGKAQFGGQRLGEMEVWALEAYGAAFTLQEMLTVKSDDTVGRTRMYEAIVKGDTALEPGLPESFNVMLKELQSLALDMQLLEETPTAEAAVPEE